MDSVISLITGEHLDPVWSALIPTLLVASYFIGGMIIWSIKCALFGIERDEETLKRGSTKIMGFYLRHYYFWLTRPIWGFFFKMRIPPTVVTTLSALIGISSGIAAAAGRFALAGWLFIFSGMLDTFDGRLARSRGLSTTWGAAIDSTLDRYADMALLMGMAWYYRNDGWPFVACLFMMMGVALVPYIRARGEALGVKVTGGLMQRPERTMYLGGALALSPVFQAIFWPEETVHPMQWVAAGMLLGVTVITNWTALTRLYTLVDALKHDRKATALTEEERAKEREQDGRSTGQKMGFNVLAAIVATGADFVVVLALVRTVPLFESSEGMATAVGCIVGGVVNFLLNRVVTFRSKSAILPQAARYAGASFGSMVFNALGVSLCLSLVNTLEFGSGTGALTVVWWVVRGLVFLLWNYPMHSMYVFGDGALMAQAVARENSEKSTTSGDSVPRESPEKKAI